MRHWGCKAGGAVFGRWACSVALGALVLGALPGSARAQQGPILDCATGHYYQAVVVSEGLDWESANAAAQSLSFLGVPGHLATITSAAENQFLVDNFPLAIAGGFWLGGFQTPGILDPAAGWQWVTGEPFVYTNWNPVNAEPNDAFGPGSEDRLQFWFFGGGTWNDALNLPPPDVIGRGYVVEFDTPAPTPVISGASANPAVLSPPNHKLVDVTVNYTVNSCSPANCVLSVSSNEPQSGLGDGRTASDWIIVDAHHVQLRAERSGTGSARVYTITIHCTDNLGSQASQDVTVTVPHDEQAGIAPLRNPGNKHYYLAVSVPGTLSWDAANAGAQGLTFKGAQGHLATITSAAENQFLVANFPEAIVGGYWLGGFQPPGIADPAAGWQWVTGEPFSYTNWGPGEPNDFFGFDSENRLQLVPSGGGQWNDAPAGGNPGYGTEGYVVEFDTGP